MMTVEERERIFNPAEVGPHKFERKNDLWWCSTEDVNADECVDYNRCNNECVCNNREQGEENG